MKAVLIFVAVSLASSIFVIGETLPATTPADKAAIVALGNAWAERFNAHDAKGLADLFTDDCVRMPNEAKTTIGRKALADAYQVEFAEVWKTDATVKITTEEVVLAGNYAFGRGADTTTQHTNGKATSETGKWMAICRRESTGWKFYWSTYN